MTRPLGIALWCVFALLVLAGGAMFLRACGTQPGFIWARSYCPAPPDRAALRHEAEAGDDLQRQVHAAEIRLAETPDCPRPSPQPPRPAVQPPAPIPEIPRQRAESQSMDRRLERDHGNAGKLQFTLSWDTTDDLDIDVDCPGGQISSFAGHRGPGICGDGVKDVDANGDLVRNVSSSPVENVTWADDVPDGTYVIDIIEYKARANTGSIVPFSLRMRWNDEEKICHGEVTTLPESEMHNDGTQTISGTYRTLTWHSGAPLPDCDFETVNAIRGGLAK